MHKALNLVIFIFISVQAQDPRKRFLNPYPFQLDEFELNKNDDEDIPCGSGLCIKRSSGQDELGPFWANRGKRHPTYLQEPLFADEPNWIFMTREDSFHEEPFFTSRGKKDAKNIKSLNNNMRLRNRREFHDDVYSPFFAEGGKKFRSKNNKL